jgi:hypothetical protein
MRRIKVGELQSRIPYFESLPRTDSADSSGFGQAALLPLRAAG